MNSEREDKPLGIGSLSILVLLLLISSIISVNSSFAQTTDGFPESIIVSSSTNTTPHLLKLKATQQGGVETRISGFSVDMTGAVSAQANSQLLVMVTDSSLGVIEAKVRTASNQVIDLVPVASSQKATAAFSIGSLPGGVYTLDIITQKGSAKAAYEGVLSIGNQPVTVIEETTKRITNEYGDLILIFLPPEECQEGFILDDNGRCRPICDVAEFQEGEECVDVGEPPDPCTPDGPPCPPCPKGVEASWCADEDERQDTDECLRPDGTERFPGCSERTEEPEDQRTILGPEIIGEDDTPVPEEPEESEGSEDEEEEEEETVEEESNGESSSEDVNFG